MPRKTPGDIEARDSAIVAADLGATVVPLEVLERTIEALDLVLTVAQHGNPTSVTDAGVGGWMGLAAAEGASMNVRINLRGFDPADASPQLADVRKRLDAALVRARELSADIQRAVEAHL